LVCSARLLRQIRIAPKVQLGDQNPSILLTIRVLFVSYAGRIYSNQNNAGFPAFSNFDSQLRSNE
jgi:hypothetical protein